MKNNYPKDEILITKASGETEPFSEAKLRHSLKRVKASEAIVEEIITLISSELKNGDETRDIYQKAFSLLKKHERPVASRYSLKQAIMQLGPSGHPFEKLVGEILASKGYSIEVGKVISGYCVSHEIDVIALKGERHLMVECKFHNQQGTKTDVKVALYIEARFKDVEKAWQEKPNHANKFHEAWLVTNTKLTSDAIQYATCEGMKTIGWNHPHREGLEQLIDQSGLHPITCLTTLSSSQKQQLLERGVVLCKELLDNRSTLRSLGLPESKTSMIIEEINQLCLLKK